MWFPRPSGNVEGMTIQNVGAEGGTAPKPVNAARAGAPSLLVATLVGLGHAGITFYWASGGQFLLSTVSDRATSIFDGNEQWLYPVGAVKSLFALLPFLYLLMRRRLRKARIILGIGALILILWGGINTVTANLNFFGVFDSSAEGNELIGHAFVWDPLFFIWGMAVVVLLVSTRKLKDA